MMSQPSEKEVVSNVWCGRSWEGLVDRRCTLFARALSMRQANEVDVESVVSSFLAFWAEDGSDLFTDEEEWIFQPLNINKIPPPVLRAYNDHLDICFLVESLSRETEAGSPDLKVVNRLGELLEHHLLFEEEVIRPLIRRSPFSSVVAESVGVAARGFLARNSPPTNPPEESPMRARSTRMTASMRRLLQKHLADLERRIASLDAQLTDEDSVDATALLMELERERSDISDALRDATLIDDEPFDTEAIEVGDTVTIRDSQGDIDRYVLVDSRVKSRARNDWVSVSSPLGAALLGRSKGDDVRVESPAGAIDYRILNFERDSEDDLISASSTEQGPLNALPGLSSEPSVA